MTRVARAFDDASLQDVGVTPLILHVPHAGTLIPPDVHQTFELTPDELREDLALMTDWYTDDLFSEGFDPESIVATPFSRLVVDVERFPDDAHERCAKFGMGATYVRSTRGKPLRTLSETAREVLLDRFYWPHHKKLDDLVTRVLAKRNRCLVLDAHSFPKEVLPIQPHIRDLPEICIGTDAFHTPRELTRFASSWFHTKGYKVAVDFPFNGALVPNSAYRRDRRVLALMVELRRDLYMDGATLTPNPRYEELRTTLRDFRHALSGFCDEFQ